MKKITISNLKKTGSHSTILQEGVYKAHIIDMLFEENVQSEYGNADRLTIAYDVLNGNTIKRVTQLIYINDVPTQVCTDFCDDIGNVFSLNPEEDDISVIINQFVDLEISITESKKGREYNKVEKILPYTGDISDWDAAKGITPPSPKPQPKSAAADLVFGDEDADEEGGDA